MDVQEQRREHTVEVAPAVAPAPVAPVTPVAPAGGRYVETTYTSSMSVGYRARQLLWLVYGIVAAFLALDLIFHAAGANTASGFVNLVYNVGGAFNAPFRNIVSGKQPGIATIEWADVIALVIYAFAAWVVERVIVIMRAPPSRAPY